MDLINIIDNGDSFFRYQMPKLKMRKEGSGNGIKTIIENIKDISKSLERDREEICKYLQLNLNTNKKWISAERKLILNGDFTKNEIEMKLKKYIEYYVICKHCNLPETLYKKGNKQIKKMCKACGYKEKIEFDNKFTKFILSKLVNK